METFEQSTQKRYERKMRDLQRDLCEMVREGIITEHEANEWANMKAEQWQGGDR